MIKIFLKQTITIVKFIRKLVNSQKIKSIRNRSRRWLPISLPKKKCEKIRSSRIKWMQRKYLKKKFKIKTYREIDDVEKNSLIL